jgi:hypothetical protein
MSTLKEIVRGVQAQNAVRFVCVLTFRELLRLPFGV